MATNAMELAQRAAAAGQPGADLRGFQQWIASVFPNVREGGLDGLAREAQRCWEVIESNNLGQNTDEDARAQLRAIAGGILRGEPG